MRVSEIIKLAETKSEETYDIDTWLGFINAALDDLTPVAKLLKTVTISDVNIVSGGAEITIADTDLDKAHEILTCYAAVTLPEPLPKKQLRRLTMNDQVSTGWKLTYEKLILQGMKDAAKADVTVDFYKKIPHVNYDEDTGVDDVPELPEQYHSLIVLYACAKSQQKEEELSDKNDFFTEYLMGKNSMALDRIWEMEPQNRKFIRMARIRRAGVSEQ